MSAIDIASRRELFVDHYLIDQLSGTARLKMQPPQREEIVLHYENPISGYPVLVADDGRYLLYHNGYHGIKKDDGETFYESIAHVWTSDDGIHFVRPELGFHNLGDGGKNNVFWMGNPAHNFIPFRDPNPAETDPEKRFKAVGGAAGKLYPFYSADGLHWRQAQDEPLNVIGQFDSANVPLWDPVLGKYRLFSRFYRDRPAQHREGEGHRSIQSCVSDDFLHWSKPVPHQYEASAPDEQFYTNATVLVPGAEHILLSFPARYVAERLTPIEDVSAMVYPGSSTPGMAGITDAVMMSSRDGVHWQRPFPEAWMRAGLDERNWTHRNNYPAIGILPLRDDEWSMYIDEHNGWPDKRLRRLSLRPWGFASVNAGWQGGEVVTKPLTFNGGELRLNFSTSAVGSVAVEIQQPDGRPIPGFALADMDPTYGDRLDWPVRWKTTADLAALAGQPVRLRFVLKDADLFAMRFTPANGDA